MLVIGCGGWLSAAACRFLVDGYWSLEVVVVVIVDVAVAAAALAAVDINCDWCDRKHHQHVRI